MEPRRCSATCTGSSFSCLNTPSCSSPGLSQDPTTLFPAWKDKEVCDSLLISTALGVKQEFVSGQFPSLILYNEMRQRGKHNTSLCCNTASNLCAAAFFLMVPAHLKTAMSCKNKHAHAYPQALLL